MAPTLPRHLSLIARWPLGVTLTTWRYLWRTTPFHRTEEEGSLPEDAPPPLPDGVSHAEVQRPEDGSGPLFRRRYRTRIRGTDLTPEQFVTHVAGHLKELAPREFASFEKTRGQEGVVAVGDEYLVRMPGPWDGPVRIVSREPRSFRLATLDDHLEAGQIEFRAFRDEAELLVFEIESWARSGDPLMSLLYHHLRMAKETQLHMWISLLERASRDVGGRMTRGIDIHTRTVAYQVGDPVKDE